MLNALGGGVICNCDCHPNKCMKINVGGMVGGEGGQCFSTQHSKNVELGVELVNLHHYPTQPVLNICVELPIPH